MTHDELSKLYEQVADELCEGKEWCWEGVSSPLRMFANLVAAHERELCAQVVETFDTCEPRHVAEAIRKREDVQMNISELAHKFRELHAAATATLPAVWDLEEQLRATNDDVAKMKLPTYLYDIETIYDDDNNLLDASVTPIKVTRFGVLTEHGATTPTITCHDGFRVWNASTQMYFPTKEAAERVIECSLAHVRKDKATKELDAMVREYLPVLLDAIRK